MKNTSLILSIISLVAVVVFGILALTNGKSEAAAPAEGEAAAAAACKGAIVYVDLDVILARYDMANDLGSVVETKVQNIQAEINRRGKKLESAAKDFQEKMEKGLMTRSVAEDKAQKLQKQEADFNTYAAQKQQEIQEEQLVMMNQIGDAIKTYIEKYNQEKKYAMILTCQAGNPVLTADPSLNITEDVLAGLNAEYIELKNKKNNE